MRLWPGLGVRLPVPVLPSSGRDRAFWMADRQVLEFCAMVRVT